MSLIFSFFFLCLSLHACNARHIGVIDKGPSTVKFHFSDEGKIPDHSHSVGGAINGHGIVDKRQSHGGATYTQNQKQKESKDLSGSETFESSSRMGFLIKASTTEESRRRAQLVVGSADTQVKDGANISNKNKAQGEQVVVTDYDPPHQTPPIHNRHI